MISVHFQGKPFNITVIQVCAPTSNAEEPEVEQFCEDLQDILELTLKKLSFHHQKNCTFIAKVGSQEIPSKFGLEVQNEARAKAHRVFPEKAVVIANNLFPQHKR